MALAAKEVILSAGALNSTQILMLSGIGPKEQLEAFKVCVHLDELKHERHYTEPNSLIDSSPEGFTSRKEPSRSCGKSCRPVRHG